METLNPPVLEHRVLVVSVFGRGAWMASELKKINADVTFCDFSSRMGLWPKEDSIGPFGIFKNDKVSKSYLDRIYVEDPFRAQSQGLTVWLNDGPVEFKGPMTSYHHQKRELKWLPQLEDFFSKTTISFFDQAVKKNFFRSQDLFSNFEIPSYNRAGLDRLMGWLKDSGLEVQTKTELVDISVVGKKIKGVEFQGEDLQGFHEFDSVIWNLSSEETHFLFPKFQRQIFQKQNESEWSWLRYRFQLSDAQELSVLPEYFLMIADELAPWTHDNFCIVIRTASQDSFDFWILTPTVQRFNKASIEKWGKNIIEKITKRIDRVHVQIQSYPQEYYYGYEQLGPPRTPVFGEGSQLKSNLVSFYESHPETWTHYQMESRFQEQAGIISQIQKVWNLEIEKELKKRKKS